MKKQEWIFLLLMVSSVQGMSQSDVPAPEIANDPLDVIESPSSSDAGMNSMDAEPALPTFTEVGEEPAVSSETTDLKETVVTPIETESPVVESPKPVKRSQKAQRPSMPLAPDEPDANRELRFHRLYSKYNQNPTPVEAWETAVAGRQSQTYFVQRGDTLWDVSKTLFGDPNYWPKVWSLNAGQILNPHDISPALQIQFYPGSSENVPSLAVSDKVESSDVIFVENEVNGKVVEEKKVLKAKSVPVLTKLPPSLPAFRSRAFDVVPPVEVDTMSLKFEVPPVPLTNYVVQADAVSNLGTIVETGIGGKTATEYQEVFVKLKTGSGPGVYRVFKIGETLALTKKSEAPVRLVEVLGTVEVSSLVNEQENIYRALVKSAINPLEVGAFLDSEAIQTIPVDGVGASANAKAKIIGGEGDPQRRMVAGMSYVYLEGAENSLKVGDEMQVMAVQKLRNQKTKSVSGHRSIGKIRVIHTSGRFATAYVLDSTEEIMRGDDVAGAAGVQ